MINYFYVLVLRTVEDFTRSQFQDMHHILGILSVNSFVVHDGGNDETATDLIGTNLCGKTYVTPQNSP